MESFIKKTFSLNCKSIIFDSVEKTIMKLKECGAYDTYDRKKNQR